jgi:murein DD-endopeptidase / murein LD-carboxypeptidase
VVHASPARAGLCHNKNKFFDVSRRHILLFAGSLFAVFVLDGCGGSSPRFRSRESHSSSSTAPKHHGPRFSSKEVEEEVKENDKKPEKKEVEQIATGERDFRKEKNTAIKPLDQSKMMREISKYMGVSYVSGGTTSEGMDCSGYTMIVYKNSMNIMLPRSSHEQSARGKAIELSGLKFGDLIFFNTTGESASHVGIYLGDDLFAHASVSLGVTISSLQSSYYIKRYECARRIVE